MPLYEFHCDCGKTFDKLVSIEKRDDVLCNCGAKPTIKIGASSFRMSESYTVVDGEGRVHKCEQSTSNMPQELGYRYGNPNLVEV